MNSCIMHYPQIFSHEMAQLTVKGLVQALKVPWMLVAYSITNGLTTSDMEQIFTANESRNTRVLTVCSLIKVEGILVMQYSIGCMY